MKKKVLTVVATAITTASLAACGGTNSKPGNQAVYDRIANMTDCAALQQQFDVADANHTRDLKRNLDLAKIDTSYMNAAEKRMEDVGC